MLVHGLGATWRVWLPVLPALSAHHEVVAVDLPGHGESAPLPNGIRPTPGSYADAVEEQLDRLDIGTVHVAGNSMGGRIALELARRGRTQTVVAIAPVGMGTARENRQSWRRLKLGRAVAPAMHRVAGPISRTALGRSVLYGLFAARPWLVEPSELVLAMRAFARTAGFDQARESFLETRPEGLEEIGCPVTVVWGTRDRLVPFRQAARYRERIAHAEVRALDSLGHAPMSDDPALVARTILETASLSRL